MAGTKPVCAQACSRIGRVSVSVVLQIEQAFSTAPGAEQVASVRLVSSQEWEPPGGGQGCDLAFLAAGTGACNRASGSTGRLYAVLLHPDVGAVLRGDDIRRGADRGELVAQSVEGGFAVADTGIDVYPVAVHVELGLAAGVVGLQGDVEKAVDGIGGPDAAHPAGGGGGAVLDVDGFIPQGIGQGQDLLVS